MAILEVLDRLLQQEERRYQTDVTASLRAMELSTDRQMRMQAADREERRLNAELRDKFINRMDLEKNKNLQIRNQELLTFYDRHFDQYVEAQTDGQGKINGTSLQNDFEDLGFNVKDAEFIAVTLDGYIEGGRTNSNALLSLVKFFDEDSRLRESTFVKGSRALNIIPLNVGQDGDPIAQRNFVNAKNRLNELIQLDNLDKEYTKEIEDAKQGEDFIQNFEEQSFKQPKMQFDFDDAELRNLSSLYEADKIVLGATDVAGVNPQAQALEASGYIGNKSYLKYNANKKKYTVPGVKSYNEPRNLHFAKQTTSKIAGNIETIENSIEKLQEEKNQINLNLEQALETELDETRDAIIQMNADRKLVRINTVLDILEDKKDNQESEFERINTLFPEKE
tara:strand:+ start:4933 stop:6114 length:1182 start_codon:yes stop_codon:yes gene_type:complete